MIPINLWAAQRLRYIY